LALAATAAPHGEYLQAVEFPYYLYPRALWERELVWLKAIGVRAVEFSIPSGSDFTGRTSPRNDLAGFIRLLRKLDLHAWIRAEKVDSAKTLEALLATQTASHGGPIAYLEGHALKLDAPAPASPVTTISANDPAALARSRDAIARARGALLWTSVEDALYPAGWQPPAAAPLRKGAVGLGGEERAGAAALRRDAALLRNWSQLFQRLESTVMPKPLAGKLPEGVTAVELSSPVATAVSITNRSQQSFHDDLRVFEPGSKRTMVIPGVSVPAGQSLWLPVSVSIGPDGLCRECSHFAAAENIVYATAELLSVEFENGILAMEFAAPQPGEVILQLAREPVGPFLAAGKPTKFDWDEKTLRARLTIPANPAPGNHVRIGVAIEEPETAAFFNDLKRLIIGRKNLVSTTYSSPGLAARSRLRLPEGFTAVAKPKSPNEIDYEVSVSSDALHGDWVNFGLEADGVLLGRARLQLFRPASIRLMDAMQIHIGAETELTPDPPLAPVDPRAGSNLEIAILNNSTEIQTYQLEASGDGLEFFPPMTEISVGATSERRVVLRVFAAEGITGLRPWRLHVTGGTTLDLPMSAMLLPRRRTVAWTADLDGDGSPEWVLESQKVRAVFSSRDGGRWMEFTWKPTNTNFLPEAGAFAAAEPVEVRSNGDALEFTAKAWKRTVRLTDEALTIEQSAPLPSDSLTPEKRGNTTFAIDRQSPARTVYSLQ